MDSAPLEGAGRLKDTINLLAHAARKVVECAAVLLGWPAEWVCREARIPLLLAPSVKAALDRDWSDPAQKASAVKRLVIELENLKDWLAANLAQELKEPPLSEEVATLNQVMDQDLEPDPEGGGEKIREGAADRRVSVEEPEMRHGRKSKTKRFNGYKRHIATDLDTGLILSGAIIPANRPEEEAASDLAAYIARQGLVIDELFIDRGYVDAPLVDEILGRGGEIVCRPWVPRNGTRFSKASFKRARPHHHLPGRRDRAHPVRVGGRVRPRSVRLLWAARALHRRRNGVGTNGEHRQDERLQQRLRKHLATPKGQARLRERMHVEHRLAHLARRQSRRARYRGVRKNLFDLRRAAAIQNLECIQRKVA